MSRIVYVNGEYLPEDQAKISIFDRGSKTNVGELMLEYNGGGHHAAGTCQVENDKCEPVLAELIKRINVDG